VFGPALFIVAAIVRSYTDGYFVIDIDMPFETEALAESTTLTVNEDVPFTVGVPEIVPLLEPSDSPLGSDPLDTVAV
jgi:hypothetical protein